MTVPVSVQQRIRVLDAHGMSWRSIAKEVGVARDTVAKYAGREDCSPGPERSVSRPSKLDPFRATVDGWLQADRFMPRKQRHTAKRVYDRLVSEKGYEGSYSPVQRYVKRWREEHRLPSDGYLELKWHPGEAQVDFGMAQAVVGGDRVDVHCLVVTFPYSNMRYCVALPGENAECVCAGLRTVFEHIGAVPLTLVLDNATGAGHRIAWDKVTVVHVFELFVEHYRLETRFCNPNSGNEKGSVENAVGFLRRNIMVPMLNAESHGQLTRYMLERCDAMAKETHYRKGAPIGGLFAGEKMDMQPLPAKPYDAIRWEVRKADKDGRVQIDGNYYLAGPSWRGWTLDVGLRAFDVTIRTQDGRTCARLPRVYGDSPATVRNPATLLPALSRKTHAWTDSTIRDDFPDKLNRHRPHGRQDTQDHVPRHRQGQRRVRLRGRRPGRRAPGRTGARDRRGQCDHHGPAHRRRREAVRAVGTRPDRIRRVHETPTAMGKEGGLTMGTHRPPVVMPDMKRRRASTGERIATIMTLARRLPLTRQVLADQLADATPSQMEFMESWMNAEIESRERSKRSRLLKAAGFPADKELGGYDWTPIRFPVDYGRGQITTLDFIAGHDDLVLFGPPGTGKTHLAIALGRNACRKGIPARYFTAAGLVMRLLRAQSDNRLDRELAAIGRTPLLVIDELGYVPIDEDGSRLLFQVVTNAYETQSIIYTTNIEFSGWGRIFGDPNMAAAIIDRTVHHGRMIRFEGESWRKTHALMQ